jgi:hypothetical protein
VKTTPVSLKSADQSDGLYFVYFWVATITEPGDAWEPVSPRIYIIFPRAADVAANVQVTALKDISSNATVKMQVLPAGTRREDAEKWIDTPEGKAWSRGVVGGSLCSVVLDIPK